MGRGAAISVGRAGKVYTRALLALVCGYSIATTIMLVVADNVIGEFSLVGASQGLMNSMVSFGSMIAMIFTAVLQGRVKKSSMIIVSSFLMMLAMLACAFAPSLVWIIAGCAVVGVAVGWLDSYINSCIIDVNRDNSKRYMGALHGFFGVGSLLTPVVVQVLLPLTGWRGAYLAFVPIIAFMAFEFLFIRGRYEKLLDVSAQREEKLSIKELGAYLTKKRNVLLIVTVLCYSMLHSGFSAFAVYYMSAKYGSQELGSLSLTIYWAFVTLSRFFAPRIKLRPILIVSCGAFVSAAVLFTGVMLDGPVYICIAAGICGLFGGHTVPMMITESVEGYQNRSLLPATAILLTLKITAMLMPIIMAAIGYLSLTASMMLCVVGVAAAGVMSIFVYGDYKRSLPPRVR